MKSLIKKILKESSQHKFISLIFDKVKSGKIKAPYFKNLKNIGLTDKEIEIVLSNFFGGKTYSDSKEIRNEMGKLLYLEGDSGYWEEYGYNKMGKELFWKCSDGDWYQKEYDDNGNQIYFENSDGFLLERKYDERDNLIYEINSAGEWKKWVYNEQNQIVYYENSRGEVIDRSNFFN